VTTHGLHFSFPMTSPPMPIHHWAHRSGICVVQMTDQQMNEIHAPHPTTQSLQPDRLANERLPNESPPAFPSNFAVASNLSHRPVDRILYGRQGLRITPSTLPIKLHGRTLFQRLVRPLLVV